MRPFLTLLFLALTVFVSSQTKTNSDKKEAADSGKIKAIDTTTFAEKMSKAQFKVQMRSFYMQTVNEGALKDDYALAIGAGLGMLTKPIYGFQFGLSGYAMYNILSSDIDKPDPLTNQPNRYEIGLFDLSNPSNKSNLYRLEDLYIKYNISKSAITLGKMQLNTPFINPQEGRMRPSLAEGVWLSIYESSKIGFNGGWIWAVSPRSTVSWYSLENSIGIYPTGINTDGTKSGYYGSLSSSGMAIANLYYKPNSGLTLNLWDNYIDNILNTVMFEINHTSDPTKKIKLYQGLIFLHQDAVNFGGNKDQHKTYITSGAQSNVVSAQVGVKTKKINTSLNYTHITGDGRYLMPREWGKEPFYTFLPRERNEGLGNVNAYMIKSAFTTDNSHFKTGIGYGYYHLPDVLDYRLNKYAMPSYHQINLDASYSFGKILKGLELKTIVLYKLQQGEDYGNLKVIYNKVNMLNVNIILDFRF